MNDPSFHDAHWLTEEEQQVWRSFVKLSASLETALNGQLAQKSGLSQAAYDVLVLVSRSRTGKVRQRDLVNELGWRPSRLSHLLTRMSWRGLLERLMPEAHKPEIRLTPTGRQALTEATPGYIETVHSAFLDLLTQEEREAVLSISTKVVPQVHKLGLN